MFCIVHSNLPPITLPKKENSKNVADDDQCNWDLEKSIRSPEELE